MNIPNLKSKSQCLWSNFKEAPSPVTLSCPEDASVDYESLSGKTVPKDLQQLSQLVGNPQTKESVWMNACIGAGGRSLAPEHTLMAKLWLTFTSSFGAVAAVLTTILNFSLAMFLAAESATYFKGVDKDLFLSSMTAGDGAGLLTALLAGICFWSYLLITSRTIRRVIAGCSVLPIALVACGSTFVFGPIGGVVTGLLCIAAVLCSGHIGTLLRETLPRTFNAFKLTHSATGFLLVPAAFMCWVLFLAITRTHQSTSYGAGSDAGLSLFAAVFTLCIAGQGFSTARASKSKSRAACTLLAVSVQTPLLVGLGMASLVAACAAAGAQVDPAAFRSVDITWSTLGADKAFFLFSTTLVGLFASLGGGYLGAMLNSFTKGTR